MKVVDIREHHVGRIATPVEGVDQLLVDVGAVVRRLILFEQCTIESIRLKEVPALVSVFGFRGLMTLIESGVLRVICDAMTTGQIGQLDGLELTRSRGGPLPPRAYHLAAIGIARDGADGERFVHEVLQEVHKAPLSLKEAIRLKKELVGKLLVYPPAAALAGVDETVAEILEHHSWIWSAIRRVVQAETAADLGPPPAFEVEGLGHDGDFRIDAHLQDRLGLGEVDEHRLVERALLGAAGVNQRIELMRSLNAVTGFQDSEFPFFEDKLNFLMRQIAPDVQEQRFDRIVEIAGLPTLTPLPASATVDADKLLKLRNGEECRELRAWLRKVDAETDEEISRRFEALRGRMAEVVEGAPGRTIRFVVTSGAGMIPVLGPALGPALSAVDTFLLEKLVGRPGPAVFLAKHYPSIFGD
jgi:hypothetical protein